MPNFVKVATVAQVAPGTGMVATVNDKEVALFNIDGTFHAIDNVCKHRGGPLGEGELEGDTVTCPWHGWQFDVRVLDTLQALAFDAEALRRQCEAVLAVATSAVRAPFSSSRALVPTVIPWVKPSTSPGPALARSRTSSIAAITPRD